MAAFIMRKFYFPMSNMSAPDLIYKEMGVNYYLKRKDVSYYSSSLVTLSNLGKRKKEKH